MKLFFFCMRQIFQLNPFGNILPVIYINHIICTVFELMSTNCCVWSLGEFLIPFSLLVQRRFCGHFAKSKVTSKSNFSLLSHIFTANDQKSHVTYNPQAHTESGIESDELSQRTKIAFKICTQTQFSERRPINY